MRLCTFVVLSLDNLFYLHCCLPFSIPHKYIDGKLTNNLKKKKIKERKKFKKKSAMQNTLKYLQKYFNSSKCAKLKKTLSSMSKF